VRAEALLLPIQQGRCLPPPSLASDGAGLLERAGLATRTEGREIKTAGLADSHALMLRHAAVRVNV
jgi:hypothetical protein